MTLKSTMQNSRRAISIACLFFLSSCSVAPYRAVQAYYCPYDHQTIAVARSSVRSIKYRSWYGMRKALGNTNAFGDVKLYSGLEFQDKYYVFSHEVCHLYELRVLGIPWNKTKKHEGWIDTALL